MTDIADLLRTTLLFQAIPSSVMETKILPHGTIQTYTKDQFLIVPQQQITRFGIVLSGRIHILHLFPNGNSRLMRTVTAGEVLGADLICTRTGRAPYHAAAATPVQILYFSSALLTDPDCLDSSFRMELMNRFLVLVSQENMKKEYRLAILSQNGLRERITTYLTMQANRQQTLTFTIPFSREELASFLCVNRSALSHELSRMRQEGLIEFHKNQFTIHPKDAAGLSVHLDSEEDPPIF